MKKNLLHTIVTFSFSILLQQTYAQLPQWLWAKGAGGTSADGSTGIATDIAGNIYIAGYFQSPTISFDSVILTNAGVGNDIFIVKYDSNGNVLWAKRAGGTGYEEVNGICTDPAGNIYITGDFYPSITFDSITLTSVGGNDIFITKYDNNGNVLWAKNEGGISTDVATGVSTDAAGNIYVAGWFASSSISFGSTVLTLTGIVDIFITKYSSIGNVIWAKSAEGSNVERVNSVVADAAGNVSITGYFLSSSITFGSTVLTNAGFYDIFTTKYDSSGNVLWAKRAGGTYSEEGFSIATDATGNIFITGYFQSDSITVDSITIVNHGNYDVYIIKYDSNGNALWVQDAGGTGTDEGSGVSTDAAGNVYLTGYFWSTAIAFGSDILSNGNGNAKIFVTKYDNTGNVVWAKEAGGTGDDTGILITTNVGGTAYVTGEFLGLFIAFGSIILSNGEENYTDIFVAKLSNDVATGVEGNNSIGELNISPNPSYSSFTVNTMVHSSLTITDAFGRIIKQLALDPFSTSITISTDDFTAGVYLVTLNDGDKRMSKKLLVTK